MRESVDMGELKFERGHAAEFCDGDPCEDDDHGHFEGKLEKVGDEHAPKTADEGVNSSERNEQQDANQERGVFRSAEGVMQKLVAAERELEDAALGDGVAEENGGDADHGFDDPAEDEAVHQRAEIESAKTAEECGGLALVTKLDKFNVGEDFGAAPIAREEKNGHHATEALRPPEPVTGNAVFCDEAGDEERRVGGESCGDHGSAGEPPGNVAAGDEKFLGAAGGAAAIVKTDEQIEEQVGGDDDPVDGGKDHFSLYSMRRAICWFARRLSILLYSSKELG